VIHPIILPLDLRDDSYYSHDSWRDRGAGLGRGANVPFGDVESRGKHYGTERCPVLPDDVQKDEMKNEVRARS
jgi:hypothetical protein